MEFLKSCFQFIWGILRRFYIWLPPVFLDPFDINKRIIKPLMPEGWTFSLPWSPDWAATILVVMIISAAILTFHETRLKTLKGTPAALRFSNPRVERVGHGPDGLHGVKKKVDQEWLSVDIRNDPTKGGHDLKNAWVRLVVFDPNSKRQIKTIENCRWGNNPKPRLDYFPNLPVVRFLDPWNTRDLLANNQNNLINFAIRPLYEINFYGLSGADQQKSNFKTAPYWDWLNPTHKIPKTEFVCCLEVHGDVEGPARLYMEVMVPDDPLEEASIKSIARPHWVRES